MFLLQTFKSPPLFFDDVAFNEIPKVERVETYLDIAFNNATKATDAARSVEMGDKLRKSKHVEKIRIETIAKSLCSSLDLLLTRFPQIDDLAPFYYELLCATIDYGTFKQSLGAVLWAKHQIKSFERIYLGQLSRVKEFPLINATRRAFYGRSTSVLKQIKKNLEFLEQCRKTMRRYPALKTGRVTIVIAGSPNVGKSSILARLTGSAPKTAPYPFTTQDLNLGYDEDGVQYIDTPGLLDRPLDERNPIELHAILALKHLASAIVFVIDPTETCGYTIKEQRNLLLDIKKRFELPMIVVSNKVDTGEKFEKSILVSAKTGEGIPELKRAISALAPTLKQEEHQSPDTTLQ